MTAVQGPFSILVVEDEALLAMDIEAMIEDCGHRVVGGAMSLADVVALEGLAPPHVAFVDLQLADGSNGVDVCQHIRSRWPTTVVVFITANPKKIPADFAGAHGVIPKPFSYSGLVAAMKFIEQGMINPPPSGQPQSVVLSPSIAEAWAEH